MAADAATFSDSAPPGMTIVALDVAAAATSGEAPEASLPKIHPTRPRRSIESNGVPSWAAVQMASPPKVRMSSARFEDVAIRRKKCPPMPARTAFGDQGSAHPLPTIRSAMPKAEALRTAALKLLRSGPSRHPFYWAGFSIGGSSASRLRQVASL